MRAIPIDSFLEDLEQRRTANGASATPGSYDWGRIVSEGRSARSAADGGRWRIGQLALLVERGYASGALQRFAGEIGESYPTVRRYRWVVAAYDAAARIRFASLSFSHFQAVAGLPDRILWLERAERGRWSVDRLVRQSRAAQTAATRAKTPAPLDRLRVQIDVLRRWIEPASRLDDAALAEAGREWLADALDEASEDLERLRDRVRRATKAAPVRVGRHPAARASNGNGHGRRARPAARGAALKARAVGR